MRVQGCLRGILRPGPGPAPATGPLSPSCRDSLPPVVPPRRAGRIRAVGGEGRRSGTARCPAAGHGPSPRRSGAARGGSRSQQAYPPPPPPRLPHSPRPAAGRRRRCPRERPRAKGERGALRRPRPGREAAHGARSLKPGGLLRLPLSGRQVRAGGRAGCRPCACALPRPHLAPRCARQLPPAGCGGRARPPGLRAGERGLARGRGERRETLGGDGRTDGRTRGRGPRAAGAAAGCCRGT